MSPNVIEKPAKSIGEPQRVAPIVVLGHQRSGTSAIAHLLSMATNIPLVDDPPWTFTANVQRVYGDDIEATKYLEEHRDEFESGILKAPSLTPLAPIIERWNPSLRFLTVVRNPRDTIAAVLEWRRDRDKTANNSFWDMNWLGIETSDPLEMLVLRWVRYIEAVQMLKHVVWVSYDEFCCNKAGGVKRIAQTLELDQCSSIEALVDEQFKKNFGDRRIRGANRWMTELSSEQATEIEERCNTLWQSVLRHCLRL